MHPRPPVPLDQRAERIDVETDDAQTARRDDLEARTTRRVLGDDADMRAFPPRLPDQPIFYPVTNEAYERQIATDRCSEPGARLLRLQPIQGVRHRSVDPDDGRLTPLFNPRTEDWAEHFQADAGRVVPIIPVGRVTLVLLQINLTLRVEVRDELTRLGRWPRFREYRFIGRSRACRRTSSFVGAVGARASECTSPNQRPDSAASNVR
jgi:hypothetical protein